MPQDQRAVSLMLPQGYLGAYGHDLMVIHYMVVVVVVVVGGGGSNSRKEVHI